ncbi:MAG: c-type cytochrome [Candidatus Promineifilaceae bacterium]
MVSIIYAARRWQLWLSLAACFVFLIACGGEAPPEPTVVVLSAEAQIGKQVFSDNCAICHATAPNTIIRGPSMAGLVARAGERVPNQDARAYIYNSIMRPSDLVVDGFEDVMPSTLAKTLTGEELDAVVSYLLTFDK